MFKRSSVTPIFVVFLIVACFDGLFFARAENVVLDETNKQGNVVTQQGDIEFTLVLGRPRKFYRDQTQPKKLTLDLPGCKVNIERESDTEVKVDGKRVVGSIFVFKIEDDGKLKVIDEEDKSEDICQNPINIDTANAPDKSVLIKLEDDIAPGLFLYASDIRLPGVSTVSPSASTDASSTTLATTDASTPSSSSEGLSGLVYIAIGAATGLVAALVIVGIVALICCLVKKKRSAGKVVVKDVSVRTEKTKETTVGGEKSAFKDVTDNKSAYGTSVVGPSPVTPSLL